MVSISPAEWEVMRVVWTRKTVTANEIATYLAAEKDWKMPTIKTLLGRLVKKEVLAVEKQGRVFLYRACISEDEAVMHSIQSIFAQICSKQAGRTLATVLEQVPLTKDDVQLLTNTLATKKTVATIHCTCLPGQCTCKNKEEN